MSDFRVRWVYRAPDAMGPRNTFTIERTEMTKFLDDRPLRERDPVHCPIYITPPEEVPLLGVKGILFGLLFAVIAWGLFALVWWLL